MDLVVIGHGVDAAGSAELRYAEKQLLASLPTHVPLVRSVARDSRSLVQAALEAVDALCLPDDARVLLAKNACLWPAPGTFNHLEKVVDGAASAAFAHDSAHAYPGFPRDYMTLRGLERYVATLAAQLDHPVLPGADLPALALTTAGALRLATWGDQAVWGAHAFVHDFSGYQQGQRDDVVPIIPASVKRILDVGGGEGGFLKALKKHLVCETHLAEFSNAACALALASDGVDKVWPGDFMTADLDVKFDCITFLDVLEHTESPVQWLHRAAQLLEPDGCVVASIPNVGHWSVVADLLEGRWDYAPAGIHCVTHLRFFTRYGVAQLMAEAGLKIEKIEAVRIDPPQWFDVSAMQGPLRTDADSLSSFSFLVKARAAA